MSRHKEVQAEAKQIGERIKQIRMKQGWTLADLGVLANLSAQHISRIELGQIMPTRPTLERLAHALNVPQNTLAPEWPYQVADGLCAGLRARIIDPPRKAYKPHPLDGPDPVWCLFEQRWGPQWFPRGRLQP